MHWLFPYLETVRQVLGLEEDQVAEISGDHEKYEVRTLNSMREMKGSITWNTFLAEKLGIIEVWHFWIIF